MNECEEKSVFVCGLHGVRLPGQTAPIANIFSFGSEIRLPVCVVTCIYAEKKEDLHKKGISEIWRNAKNIATYGEKRQHHTGLSTACSQAVAPLPGPALAHHLCHRVAEQALRQDCDHSGRQHDGGVCSNLSAIPGRGSNFGGRARARRERHAHQDQEADSVAPIQLGDGSRAAGLQREE